MSESTIDVYKGSGKAVTLVSSYDQFGRNVQHQRLSLLGMLGKGREIPLLWGGAIGTAYGACITAIKYNPADKVLTGFYFWGEYTLQTIKNPAKLKQTGQNTKGKCLWKSFKRN